MWAVRLQSVRRSYRVNAQLVSGCTDRSDLSVSLQRSRSRRYLTYMDQIVWIHFLEHGRSAPTKRNGPIKRNRYWLNWHSDAFEVQYVAVDHVFSHEADDPFTTAVMMMITSAAATRRPSVPATHIFQPIASALFAPGAAVRRYTVLGCCGGARATGPRSVAAL